MNKLARRMFLRLSGISIIGMLLTRKVAPDSWAASTESVKEDYVKRRTAPDSQPFVYLARNDSPENNMRNVIEMMGGIREFIGPEDIVLLKPNSQWWNQGTTNTDAMKAFIEMVLEIEGFEGEIIVADNHHFPDRNDRGWTTELRNGAYNLNELIENFQRRGHRNVTKYHWHDGGPSVPGLWGGAENGGIVNGPEEGDGYVWRQDLVYAAPNGRKALMSYPIFTSQYSGVTIDFMKGPWKNGRYLQARNLKFINFSGLNHHGDTGVTASIKNYLGICDMTCGYRGEQPDGFYNFHIVAASNVHWRLKKILKKVGWEDYLPAIGGCVGYFMKKVRVADLNIVTAEWVGYGSRTDPNFRAHTRSILASVDPVALDYTAAAEILVPATFENTTDPRLRDNNNPTSRDSPFREFLQLCHDQGVGRLDAIELVEFRS